MRNVERKLFTHPLLYQNKENRRDVQTARAHTASVLATDLDSKKRRPLTVVTRVRVADPSQLPPVPTQISMQPLELCVIRSNVSGTHTCLSLGTSHQVTSSARNGPVHAGIPYRNFFLFLNFIPALTNISSSLHGLGESPVPVSNVVASLHLLLGLSVSRFPDGWYLYACSDMLLCSILCRCAFHLFLYSIIFSLKGEMPNSFLIWFNLMHP
jgi:hypothetical protein